MISEFCVKFRKAFQVYKNFTQFSSNFFLIDCTSYIQILNNGWLYFVVKIRVENKLYVFQHG